MRRDSDVRSVSLPVLPTDQSATVENRTLCLLTRDGDSCVNMRSRIPGTLEGLPKPQELARCGHFPVFSDTRDGVTYVFTLDMEGCLRVEISVDADGNVVTLDKRLGVMPPGVCLAARVGDFVVISDSASQLHYVLWNRSRRDYVWLDAVPEMPPFNVESVEDVPFKATVAAQTFAEPVADMRQGVPEKVAQQVNAAVAAAEKEARQRAADAGVWTAPIVVRLAVRLWDGTLMHLSAPHLVAPCAFVANRRVGLPLVSGDSGFTGTGATDIEVPSYRLRVGIDTSALAAWGNVVREVEIWVSREHGAATGGTGQASYTSVSGKNTLWAQPAYADDASLTAALTADGYVCAATVECSVGIASVMPLRPRSEADGDAGDLAAEARSRFVVKASALEGHGGFLHLAGYTRRYPHPELPQGEERATTLAKCRVAVRLHSLRGGATVVADGEVRADDGMILPMLWYPDSSAVSMTVSLEYEDGRVYEQTWQMQRAPRGENAAYVPAVSTEALSLPRVDMATGYAGDTSGDVYVDGTLLTMRRGNPFVEASSTPYAGGHISHIRAQQSGGGAYTRQYVYLFSDTGITALTHDMEGRHVNCRPISRSIASRRSHVSSGDDGVWALTDSGTLLRLRDSRVETVLRGLPVDSRVAAHSRLGEVWLMPGKSATAPRQSLVLTVDDMGDGQEHGCLSTYTPDATFAAGDAMLGITLTRDPEMAYVISRVCAPGRMAQRMSAEWKSPVLSLSRGGLCNLLLGITGSSVDATVEVRALPPYTAGFPDDTAGDLLTRAAVKGDIRETVSLPFILPDPALFSKTRSNRLRVIVRGQIPAISAYGFEIAG